MNPLIPLRSQARLWLRRFAEGETLAVTAGCMDSHFVHLLDGLAYAEDERLSAGDGMQIPPEETVTLHWHSHGAALVFEMPVSQARAEVAGAAAIHAGNRLGRWLGWAEQSLIVVVIHAFIQPLMNKGCWQ